MKINNAYKSPNFNDRKSAMVPSMIILHYTGRPTGMEAIKWLCNPEKQVSAHYVVEENGEILQLVAEDKRSWHAGISYWQGETDINSASIGIEIVNPGHEFGYRPFPLAQITAVITLCHAIMRRHNIGHVLAHSDVAPGRKIDPGPLFPWRQLAAEGVGQYPSPIEVPKDFNRTEALHALGYNPDTSPDVLWQAFKLHYPEKPDETLASLAAL